MASPPDIAQRIVQAVLAQKLLPGARLGEQQLATLFGCTRAVVREALSQLSVRGIVTVSARRGWYVVELSDEAAREAFAARRVIETGLIRCAHGVDDAARQRLRAHLGRQQEAVRSGDTGLRSFMLGDFHVCLAECLGSGLLADILRDLTARTTLTAVRYQSEREAAQSCAEHAYIVEALEAGDLARAEQLMADHLDTWKAKLPVPEDDDPLERLRLALEPIELSRLAEPQPSVPSRVAAPPRRAPASTRSIHTTAQGEAA